MRTLVLIAFTSSLAGCAGGATPEAGAPAAAIDDAAVAAAADPSLSGYIVRTLVHRHADGSETSEEQRVPLAQAQAERDSWLQRRAGGGAIHANAQLDGSCSTASMWIFDHTYAHPSGTFPYNHEICFFDEGSFGCADLRSYSRYCTVWNHHFQCVNWATNSGSSIQSFFSGRDAGYFTGLYQSTYYITSSFGPDYQVDDIYDPALGTQWQAVQYAQYVCL
ncbi:MAG: hypothetical protein ACXVDD_00350 [Polyangia bacterium]